MKSKRGVKIVIFILLLMFLAFTFYIRTDTPEKRALEGIAEKALGAGEIRFLSYSENSQGQTVGVYEDDVYRYTVLDKTGELLGLYINTRSMEKLDSALVEENGVRVSEEEAEKTARDIVQKLHPEWDMAKLNFTETKTDSHLDEFRFDVEGGDRPLSINLAFNGQLSGVNKDLCA